VRGRKPKPTAQRALEGNPGKRPLNLDEPAHEPPTDAFDQPPPELTGQAAVEWRRLAPLLRRSRQVGEVDRGALMALCIEWARYLDAIPKAQPLIVRAPSGYPMPNPYLSIAKRALDECRALWPELGLTPSSRARVKTELTGPGPGGDSFSEFDDPLPPMPSGVQ
jgi:P27 family predicted phage terminase small subunit